MSNAPIAGVAVTITSSGNTHAGMIYRDAQDKVRLLHLAFHCILEDSEDYEEFLCADPELEPEDAEAIAGYCRQIAKDRPPIWFAIHYNNKARFVEVNRKLQLDRKSEAKGLNCSTFVLTIFHCAGLALVDMAKWQARKEDAIWHKQLVHYLSYPAYKAPKWYIKQVGKDTGCARVRPEEVAGACLEAQLPSPVGFEKCRDNGLIVVNRLEKHTSRKKKW